MPDHEDSLGGETFSGEAQRDPAEQSLGDGVTLGGDTSGHSLGDQSTLGDSNVDDELLDDGMKLEDLSERYTEEGVLGKGGMGEVILATDTRLGRKVAIKRIIGKAARSKTAVQRFLTEAQSMAELSHPNIVQIYDYGRVTDGPFLIMECVQGGSLLEKCKAGPIELDEAVNLFGQLCDGLAKAHAANIVHRDIKPANVLMTEDGIPKLTDFGLAKDDTADTGMTMNGAVIGTLDFMPPEQRQGAEFTDHRSDLWSLAATFYQMLTGKSPKVINVASLPPHLQSVVAKALEEEKEERYQSVQEMREAILQAATAGLNASRDLGEGECPTCGTTNPSDRKFCRNGDCAASLEVDCLGCKDGMPMWEAVCGSCGTKQNPLIEEAKAELQTKHDEAEALLSEFKFDEALQVSSVIGEQSDFRLQQFTAWYKEFSQRLLDIQTTDHERLKKLLEEAKTHEEKFDYEASRLALKQVDKRLRDRKLKNLGSAKSIGERIRGVLRRIEDLTTANQTVKEQALVFLEEFKFDKAIEASNRIETDDHPHLKEDDAWLNQFVEEVRTKRIFEYKQHDDLLSQAIKHEGNVDYKAARRSLDKIDERLKDIEFENKGSAKSIGSRITGVLRRIEDLSTTNERVKEQAVAFLEKLEFDKAIEASTGIKTDDHPHLKEDDAWLSEFADEVRSKRDSEYKQLKDKLSQAIEHEERFNYEAGLLILTQVPAALKQTTIIGIKDTADHINERLTAKQLHLKELETTVRNRYRNKEFAGLLSIVDELLTLKHDRADLQNLKAYLEKRDADLLAVRENAVKQALQELEEQKYAEAIETLNAVPKEVWNENFKHHKTTAIDSFNHLTNLRERITTAVNGDQLKDLLPTVEECLIIKADQGDLVKLKQVLIDRGAQIDARNHQIISKAQMHMQQLQFGKAVQILATITKECQTSVTIALSQQAQQFAANRLSSLNTDSLNLSNKNYRVAINTISNYLSEIAAVDIRDPQLEKMLEVAKCKKAASIRTVKFVLLGILASGVVLMVITAFVIKINLNTRAVDAAITNLDWEMALELDPDNAEGLRLKAAVGEKEAAENATAEKHAAVSTALGKGDWKVVLALDPGNNEGLRLKADAATKADREKIAIEKRAVDMRIATEQSAAKLILPRPPISNTIGMRLKLIPAGTFLIGSPVTEEDHGTDEHQHMVTITRNFYIQTTEVTQEQWKSVMSTEPWKGKFNIKEGADYPATYLDWDDAVAFCKALSSKERQTYRLPTEAEWEYACRAETKTTWSFGDDKKVLGEYAWYHENTGSAGEEYAHQVELKRPNAWGLHDMHGNVFEWCSDYWYARYYWESPEADPQGPASGSFRVLRGGAWSYDSRQARSAMRLRNQANFSGDYNVGFRIVRELD